VTNRPRALAVLLAVFLVGGIAGAAGSYYWLRRDMRTQQNHRRDPGPPGLQGRQKWQQLLYSLQLTPEQDARFKEIMMESWKQMEELRKEAEPIRRQMSALMEAQEPKITAIRTETNRRFSAILNPEQREKFEAFLKEAESMGRRPPRGRDFGPPPEEMRGPR
jgi:Spy/CpxP family protein refolding chaperone